MTGHLDDEAELEQMTTAATVNKWVAMSLHANYVYETRKSRPCPFSEL